MCTISYAVIQPPNISEYLINIDLAEQTPHPNSWGKMFCICIRENTLCKEGFLSVETKLTSLTSNSYFMSVRNFKHVSILVENVSQLIQFIERYALSMFNDWYPISHYFPYFIVFCFMDTFYLIPCINITPTPDEIELSYIIANSMISIKLKLIVDKLCLKTQNVKNSQQFL